MILDQLRESLSGSEVIPGEEVEVEELLDATPMYIALAMRGWRPPRPAALVRIGSEEDVARVLDIAYRNNVSIVPRGGGSGVVAGSLPVEGGILVDLRGLNWIRVDEEDMTVDVGAGVYGHEVEGKLSAMGYTLRHSPQSLYDSTVGGWVSAMSSGQYSTMYGGVEELVKAVRVAVPGMGLLSLGSPVRRAVGPDLSRLFIGSEGTLGIVTAATLRMLPQPEAQKKFSAILPSFEEGLKYLRRLILRGVRPAVARLYDPGDTVIWFPELSEVHGKTLLIMLVEGVGEVVEAELRVAERYLPKGSEVLGGGPADYWLKNRFKRVSDIRRYLEMGILFDTVDMGATWSKLPALYREIRDRLGEVEGVAHVSAHASHFQVNGGCIYVTVAGASDDVKGFYSSLWRSAAAVAHELGATISHHHGVGTLKKAEARRELGGSIKLLKAIKRALDPKLLLNPGVLVGEP